MARTRMTCHQKVQSEAVTEVVKKMVEERVLNQVVVEKKMDVVVMLAAEKTAVK